MIELVKPGLKENDRTFWMDFNDIIQHDQSSGACHLLTLKKKTIY